MLQIKYHLEVIICLCYDEGKYSRFQFRCPGKFHLKPVKGLENSNLQTYPMEFYSFMEDLEFYIHPSPNGIA